MKLTRSCAASLPPHSTDRTPTNPLRGGPRVAYDVIIPSLVTAKQLLRFRKVRVIFTLFSNFEFKVIYLYRIKSGP